MKKVNLFIFIIILSYICFVSAIEPTGSSINEISSSTTIADIATGIPAIAGNVTELSISGFSTTQSWQGYFGNVTGTITLSDSGDNSMYNWSLASPQGEIYASTNNSLAWDYIQCFNFDADGTYADDTLNIGGTSQHGTNLSILEEMFGIAADDVDGVNETFTLLGTGHNTFYTNNIEFSEGECRSTQIFSNSGTGEDNKFEEVLLYEPTTRSIVFTSLLNEDILGFDDRTHDFEMLVLENGHATDTLTTTYYFWVELE
jgi:hypothetical protein